MCLYPRTLSNGQTVKCGKCLECLKQYQDSWMIRLAEESRSWKYVFFLTLTYDQDHLPTMPFSQVLDLDPSSKFKDLRLFTESFKKLSKGKDYWRAMRSQDSCYDYLKPGLITSDTLVPYVCYDHIRSWFKHIRIKYYRDFGHNCKFKYFLCSEYGPQTLRPHYHILIFTNDWMSRKFGDGKNFIQKYFIDTWKHGNVKWRRKPVEGSRGANGEVTSVTRYVSKYCAKPGFVSSPYLQLGLYSEFRLCSKGLSAAYRDSYVHDIKSIVNHYKSTGKYYVKNQGFYGYNSEMLREIHNRSFISITTKHGDIISYRLPRYVLDSIFPRTYVLDMFRCPYTGEVVKKKKSYFIADDPLQDAIKAYSQCVFSYNALRGVYEASSNLVRFHGLPFDDPASLAMASSKLLEQRHQKAYATLFKYYRDKGLAGFY